MQLWYSEEEQDHLKVSYRVDEVLFHGQSAFQTVDVIETRAYGRMLVLDGFVMITDHDEFVYHEMIAHIPMCLHKNPQHIVVIGGGDGGTVRELLKHDCVEKIVLCEIDGMVVDSCKKYFPRVAAKLDDPRVEVRIADGVTYMNELQGEIDLAIIDSTDPFGPGEGLFSGDFYKSVAKALRPDGLMVAQSESPWFKKEILARIHHNIATGFPQKKTYIGAIPTYPRGSWSWTLAAQKPIDPSRFDRERFSAVRETLQYLTEDSMVSSFHLPPFFAKKLEL